MLRVRQKAYPGLTFAEDITVCHTGNQGAKIVVKVPKMHSAFSRGRRLTNDSLTRSQAQAEASFARERESSRGSFLQPQFIKLLREPAPWGREGSASRASSLDSKFLSQVPHALRQTGTKCKFLLERGDVNTLVIFPMLITSARSVEKAAKVC